MTVPPGSFGEGKYARYEYEEALLQLQEEQDNKSSLQKFIEEQIRDSISAKDLDAAEKLAAILVSLKTERNFTNIK